MSKKSDYETVIDGKWYALSPKFDLACCDCGLVHDVRVRLKGSQLQLSLRRNGPATGGRRAQLGKKVIDV
jgi:hypothetical protein